MYILLIVSILFLISKVEIKASSYKVAKVAIRLYYFMWVLKILSVVGIIYSLIKIL
jgi:hypothetical protein